MNDEKERKFIQEISPWVVSIELLFSAIERSQKVCNENVFATRVEEEEESLDLSKSTKRKRPDDSPQDKPSGEESLKR